MCCTMGSLRAPLHACSSVYLDLALALTAPPSDELIRDGGHRPSLHGILKLQCVLALTPNDRLINNNLIGVDAGIRKCKSSFLAFARTQSS